MGSRFFGKLETKKPQARQLLRVMNLAKGVVTIFTANPHRHWVLPIYKWQIPPKIPPLKIPFTCFGPADLAGVFTCDTNQSVLFVPRPAPALDEL